MHEMGLVMNLYDQCRKELAGYGNVRLVKVRVAVGELSAIDPELLKFAWQATVSPEDAQCDLEIEWRPAAQVCPACDEIKPRNDGEWLLVCPDCGGPLRVEGGLDLDLLQLSFDSEEG